MKSPAEILGLRKKTDMEIIDRERRAALSQAEWKEKYAPPQVQKLIEEIELRLESWATDRFDKNRKNELLYFMTHGAYKVLGPMVVDTLILSGYKAYGFEYPHKFWPDHEVKNGFLIRIDLSHGC